MVTKYKLRSKRPSSRGSGRTVKDQLPQALAGIMTDNIKIAVIAFHLEVTVVRRKPAVEHCLHCHRMGFEPDPPRGFLAAITRVAIDIDGYHGSLSI